MARDGRCRLCLNIGAVAAHALAGHAQSLVFAGAAAGRAAPVFRKECGGPAKIR
jgi:hypothetical protein